MCGIAGFVDFNKRSSQAYLTAMQKTLVHRGPDDLGQKLYSEPDFILGLAHRRLSILDLSPLGHQPMFFNEFAIILNGEIYNFNEIKDELISLGHTFISDSDTEVVLHAFSQWNKACVDKFIGMFAFVIYDSTRRTLFACRDRVGVKPFFYHWYNGLFLFASELKAFHQHPDFQKEIDLSSLALFLQYGYVPGPSSIFKNVFKMEPGTWLTFDLDKRTFKVDEYWNIEKFYITTPLKIGYEEAKVETEKLLMSACKYRMVADVPVGIFLSGGFDSTMVTALLQKDSSTKLKTFTIGFPDGVNEAPYAAKVAKYLGTNHTSYDCTESDAKAIIPDLAYFYDEPCADISAIPTILVSRLARQDVTVALSADGGDELFVGYNTFKTNVDQLRTIRKIPAPKFSGRALHLIASVISTDHVSLKRKALGIAKVLSVEKKFQVKELVKEGTDIPGNYVKKLLNNIESCYHPLVKSDWTLFADERNGFLMSSFDGALKDLLLVKMDRATMSVGLEAREPLLDHRLVEFSAQLPYEFKHDGSISKKILKDILYKYVPQRMMDRPKTGFDLPIYKWLKGDLSYLIEEFLSEENLKKTNVFDLRQSRAIINNFKNDKLHYTSILWRMIFFQMWYKRWMH
jgi:asparagine synthase (glutamine-hydrolysing)